MSSAVAPPPAVPGSTGPRHPIGWFAERVNEVLDSLVDAETWTMPPAEQADALLALHRAAARLAELRLRVLAAADNSEVGLDQAASSTAAWLAHSTRAELRQARADVRLAHRLDTDFRTTRRALATGDLDREQARVIVRAVDDLPDDVAAQDRRRGEEHLVGLARDHDAGELRMLGRHLLEVVAPDEAERRIGEALAAEEREAERRTCLRLRAGGDGTVTGVFRIPDRHAAMLERALRGLTAPARIGNEARQDDDGGWKPTAEVLGQGLCELIERYPADRIPRLSGVNAQVVVTMTLEQLRGGLGVAALDDGGEITAAQARRLACEAGLVPLVLGGRSEVLDVGRERRFHTPYQRIAIRHRDRRCTAEGCAVPAHLCHVHHDEVSWADGGGTSVDRGRLLCRWHHGRAHDARYRMDRMTDGSVRFARRT